MGRIGVQRTEVLRWGPGALSLGVWTMQADHIVLCPFVLDPLCQFNFSTGVLAEVSTRDCSLITNTPQ